MNSKTGTAKYSPIQITLAAMTMPFVTLLLSLSTLIAASSALAITAVQAPKPARTCLQFMEGTTDLSSHGIDTLKLIARPVEIQIRYDSSIQPKNGPTLPDIEISAANFALDGQKALTNLFPRIPTISVFRFQESETDRSCVADLYYQPFQ